MCWTTHNKWATTSHMVAERFLFRSQDLWEYSKRNWEKEIFLEGSISGPILDNKVQVTKIPGTKGLLTTFGGTPTESPRKAVNQFKLWMVQNGFSATNLWKTYFPLMLTGTPTYGGLQWERSHQIGTVCVRILRHTLTRRRIQPSIIHNGNNVRSGQENGCKNTFFASTLWRV